MKDIRNLIPGKPFKGVKCDGSKLIGQQIMKPATANFPGRLMSWMSPIQISSTEEDYNHPSKVHYTYCFMTEGPESGGVRTLRIVKKLI